MHTGTQYIDGRDSRVACVKVGCSQWDERSESVLNCRMPGCSTSPCLICTRGLVTVEKVLVQFCGSLNYVLGVGGFVHTWLLPCFIPLAECNLSVSTDTRFSGFQSRAHQVKGAEVLPCIWRAGEQVSVVQDGFLPSGSSCESLKGCVKLLQSSTWVPQQLWGLVACCLFCSC